MIVDLNQICAVSAEDAAEIVGCGLNSEEFSEPGVYYIRVISGDKFDSEVTELDCLGDITEIEIPSKEDAIAELRAYVNTEAGSGCYYYAIEDDLISYGYAQSSPPTELSHTWIKVV